MHRLRNVKNIFINKIRSKLMRITAGNEIYGKVDKTVNCHHHVFVDKFTTIKEYSSVNIYSQITKTEIYKYVSIGSYVQIGAGEHDINIISTSSIFYDDPYKELTKKDTVIGNDVWIGSFAFINRGVKIGDGAVIGAHAVVTRDVPDYAIVVGIPAKTLRFRFNNEKIAFLKQIEWWNWPKDKIYKNLHLFREDFTKLKIEEIIIHD